VHSSSVANPFVGNTMKLMPFISVAKEVRIKIKDEAYRSALLAKLLKRARRLGVRQEAMSQPQEAAEALETKIEELPEVRIMSNLETQEEYNFYSIRQLQLLLRDVMKFMLQLGNRVSLL